MKMLLFVLLVGTVRVRIEAKELRLKELFAYVQRACCGADDSGAENQRPVRTHKNAFWILGMEQVIQITALCVVGALLALVVRRGTPELALLLAVACTVTVLLFLAEPVEELLDFLRELGEYSGVTQSLFTPLYKTIGIAFVVKLGGELCRDAGEAAIAAVVEMAGAVCTLLVALPLLQTVLSLVLELMR